MTRRGDFLGEKSEIRPIEAEVRFADEMRVRAQFGARTREIVKRAKWRDGSGFCGRIRSESETQRKCESQPKWTAGRSIVRLRAEPMVRAKSRISSVLKPRHRSLELEQDTISFPKTLIHY